MMFHFTRIEHFTLQPGNKTAGFTLAVSRDALAHLIRQTNQQHSQKCIVESARERMLNSGLFDEGMASSASIEFYKDTLCPRVFGIYDMFGGSISADPDVYDKLLDPNYAQRLYYEEYYTPHNVDDPRSAMGLMILTQAWTEEVFMELMSMKRSQDLHLAVDLATP